MNLQILYFLTELKNPEVVLPHPRSAHTEFHNIPNNALWELVKKPGTLGKGIRIFHLGKNVQVFHIFQMMVFLLFGRKGLKHLLFE